MEKVACLPDSQREELFRSAAARKGIGEALVEKDFWVCLVLKLVFETPGLRDCLLLKGGTSLSKVYGLINRFSEDVDLVLDWRELGSSDEEAWSPARSATQQDVHWSVCRARVPHSLRTAVVYCQGDSQRADFLGESNHSAPDSVHGRWQDDCSPLLAALL